MVMGKIIHLVISEHSCARNCYTRTKGITKSVGNRYTIGEASMLPRIHQDSQSTKLNYEKTMSSDTQRILESYGHNLELSDTMGSTQSISIIDGVRFGYADLRRPNASVSVQK